MDNPEKLLTLPLTALRSLLFRDESLEGITPITPGIGDTAKVLVIHRAIGELIQYRDQEEEYFHVELCEAAGKTWAELWLEFEWKESNRRRERVKNYHCQDNTLREKRNRRINELVESISTGDLANAPDGFKRHLAEKILENYTKYDFRDVLRALNVVEKLAAYEKEDQNRDNTDASAV